MKLKKTFLPQGGSPVNGAVQGRRTDSIQCPSPINSRGSEPDTPPPRILPLALSSDKTGPVNTITSVAVIGSGVCGHALVQGLRRRGQWYRQQCDRIAINAVIDTLWLLLMDAYRLPPPLPRQRTNRFGAVRIVLLIPTTAGADAG
jgi:hypothetical protein